MPPEALPPAPAAPATLPSPQTAHARIALGPFQAEAEIGPRGLLALGALVSGILLSSAVIVCAAQIRRPR